jgi:asparagine synthase (glutamine-hydrolysing)
MCGLAAVFKREDVACPVGLVLAMRDDVRYRGPDDEGAVFLAHGGKPLACPGTAEEGWTTALGHRRLSILDLSAGGHQPMGYGGRYWVIHNGEIYNYLELRTELTRAGHTFRSTSDTEVILAAFAEWGTGCFRRFRGMWSLVIVDALRGEAVMSRDRMGIKPLYHWRGQGLLGVASELKQFLRLPGFRARLDPRAAAEYLATGYEHLERTFLMDVEPIQPGTWRTVDLSTLALGPSESYWEPERVRPLLSDATEAGRLFAAKLRESVAMHVRSDVPVGSALSGGLDSSALALLVDELHAGDAHAALHTFTSTFPGHALDERSYVNAVLARIRAVPHFVTPDPETFVADLDRFVWVHDEPVGSLSVYAAWCVARSAREAAVPVTLNGQGGDEILSGYWQTYFLHLFGLARRGRALALGRHLGGALAPDGNAELLAQVPVMMRRYRARRRPAAALGASEEAAHGSELLRGMLALDGQQRRVREIRSMFLPRLLKWDDRNSMAFSIEGRYPFLDHELIELCLSFAPETLFHRGWVKRPLRLGLAGLLPPDVVHRRTKLGFEVPQDAWLSGPLRPLLAQWLDQDRPVWDLADHGKARRLAETTWSLAGRRDEPGQALLRLFLFDRWLERFGVTL